MSTNFIFTVYSFTEYVQTVQVPVLLHVDGTAVDFVKEIRTTVYCDVCWQCAIWNFVVGNATFKYPKCIHCGGAHVLVLPFCCISFVRFDFVCVNKFLQKV